MPCYLWDLSSPAGDWTRGPWSRSAGSWPLGCWEGPCASCFPTCIIRCDCCCRYLDMVSFMDTVLPRALMIRHLTLWHLCVAGFQFEHVASRLPPPSRHQPRPWVWLAWDVATLLPLPLAALDVFVIFFFWVWSSQCLTLRRAAGLALSPVL